MKIYVDVTQLIAVPYVTGIQRVVREVLLRLLKEHNDSFVLLNYNKGYRMFEFVDIARFVAYFSTGEGEKSELTTGQTMDINTIGTGDVFFDIDGVWNLPLRRSEILPIMKRNGVKLVVYVYDIIPITHPQFFFNETLNNFMNYIGSYLQYADLIIASAQSTLDAIDELLEQLQLPSIPTSVSWLGADFKVQEAEGEIAEEAIQAVEAGKYVLMIGTIEPRKNHALVLDAFEKRLFDKGVNLIFAGRIGWNMEAFKQRIEKQKQFGKQFFVLQGMNDITIDYLYKHAYCVAFPTFNEGFGLPIIESFQRGVPVLASDIPILREVGGDYCEFFDPYSWESFSNSLEKWLKVTAAYDSIKEKIRTYEPVTWDEVAGNIWDALSGVDSVFPYEVPNSVKQIVYLSARKKDLFGSLPYVEAFMPFIQEIVVCCPDKMAEELAKDYQGRLQLTCITDSQLLGKGSLPKDHAMRNFFLRCRMVRQPEIDNVFIMADDDYRPLRHIDERVFLREGVYQGYYCYRLHEWLGEQSNPTSFDYSMYRTCEFLEKHKYSLLMYDSHQPQIIDKRIFNELLDKYPGIEELGLSDWSVYFNYLNTHYACQINNHPCVTLAWPGNITSWNTTIQPEEYLFENYYEDLYEDNLFSGFSKTYYDGIEEENQKKIMRYANAMAEHNQARVMFKAYCANYEWQFGECPYFAIDVSAEGCNIYMPEYVAISEHNFTRIPFAMNYLNEVKVSITYRILDIQGNMMVDGMNMLIATKADIFELPVKSLDCSVKAVLEIETTVNDVVNTARTKLCIMKKGI